MKFILSLIFTLFFIGSIQFISATTVENINPEEQAKQMANFKAQMLEFQLQIKRGDLVNGRSNLENIISMAEKEYSQLENRKNWIQGNACDDVDLERINYYIKGRDTKQKELISSLNSYFAKTDVSVADYDLAKNYVQFFYESMVESHDEVKQVIDKCK